MNIQVKEEWLQDNGKYACPECGKEYTKKGISTHIWRTHTKKGQTHITNDCWKSVNKIKHKCKYCERVISGSTNIKKHEEKCKHNPMNDKSGICERCGKKHNGMVGSGRYCSIKCSKTRVISVEQKIKLSKRFKGVAVTSPHTNIQYNICVMCNKLFVNKNKCKCCSKDCLDSRMRQIGRKVANLNIRRSKNEKYFAILCKKYFGTKNILTNTPIFNGWYADIIIEDKKIAILWNGKWHYEKITKKHSLKQVQNRDKIKIKEIKKKGFIPYIIKDMGRYNQEFVKSEFDKFIYSGGLVTQDGSYPSYGDSISPR